VKLVVFGLTMSSSWGNGHATLWRALCRALVKDGHAVTFFERDVSYYAAHRDLTSLEGVALHIFRDWDAVRPVAERELKGADAAMVTSHCPDASAATELVLSSRARTRVFYDLDTPVTLERLAAGERVSYVPDRGLADFDLVLSYTGAQALEELRTRLGARHVLPLYGSVDPERHFPSVPLDAFRADVSYLGTYAKDRHEGMERLLLEPARRLASRRFVVGGSQYPAATWPANVRTVAHVDPSQHPSFFASSRLTLNVTRQAMAKMGSCPSGRLFEAAACGTPILSDSWDGLDAFFQPGEEILVTDTTEGALEAMSLSDAELKAIGARARARTLEQHTSAQRARELVHAIDSTWARPEWRSP
jgi:spore maturation protein CgeB